MHLKDLKLNAISKFLSLGEEATILTTTGKLLFEIRVINSFMWIQIIYPHKLSENKLPENFSGFSQQPLFLGRPSTT